MRLTVPASLIAALPCATPAWAAGDDPLQACRSIAGPLERVACYDRLLPPVTPAPAADTAAEPATTPPAPLRGEGGGSRLDRYWELHEEAQRGRFVMLPFKPNYALPVTYNSSPNGKPFAGGDFNVEELEVKFQFSFKMKLWQDMFDSPVDLWLGYTQQSYWQLFDQRSSPFRETDYEPTVFAVLPVRFNAFGLTTRFLSLGVVHQSNGRGEPLSRSWNRIVGAAVFERGNLVGQLRAWYRMPEDESEDDNPDIDDYLGFADVALSYTHGRQVWSAILKGNWRFDRNRSGIELGWSFPLWRESPLRGYVQYYRGYGESLLDYNANANRVGISFVVNDWF